MKLNSPHRSVMALIGTALLLSTGIRAKAAAPASDDAASYTTATWINGSNAGTGFGPWNIGAALGNQITTSAGNSGSPNIDSGGVTAFRIARAGTAFVQAQRSFTAGGNNNSPAMDVGQSFQFSFDLAIPTNNNQAAGLWLTNEDEGERWGIEIGRSSSGVNQFRFKVNGSAAIISGIPTAGVNHGGNVNFRLLAEGAWTATIELLGEGGGIYEVASTDEGFQPLAASPTGFRFFFANTPAGQNQFFNNFAVVSPATGQLPAWRTLHGLAADGSQDELNPSGDGLANLLKYALNLAPNAGDLILADHRTLSNPNGTTVAELTGLPVLQPTGTMQAAFTYLRRKASGSPGISYEVQWSDGLGAWTPNVAASESTSSLDDTWERVTLTDSFTAAQKPSRFARLRIATVNPATRSR